MSPQFRSHFENISQTSANGLNEALKKDILLKQNSWLEDLYKATKVCSTEIYNATSNAGLLFHEVVVEDPADPVPILPKKIRLIY